MKIISKPLIIVTLIFAALTTFGCQDAALKDIALLSSDDDATCVLAARRLGESGEKSALPSLLKVLKDGSKVICREEAAKTAIKIGEPEVIVDTLLEVAASNDSGTWAHLVAVEAFESLGQRAVDPLIEAIEKNVDPRRKQEAIMALGRIKDAQAIKTLSKVVQVESGEVETRSAALAALGSIGSSEAGAVITGALIDNKEDPSLRASAMEALTLTDPVKAEGVLFSIMVDEYEKTALRSQAALWLADLPEDRAIKPLVEIMTGSEEGWERSAIAARFIRYVLVETRTRKLRVKFATGFGGGERLARVQKEIGKRLKLKPGDEDAFGSLSVDYQEGELNDKLGISLSRNEEELLFETSIDGPAGRLVASNQKNPYLKYLDWLIRAKLAHPEIDDDSLFKIFALAESKR